jgi:hypothetical protein
MVRRGVTAGTLRKDHTGGDFAWTIELWKDKEVPNDKAKDAAKDYLREEFEAVSITFFTRQGKGPNHFFARFRSYAL